MTPTLQSGETIIDAPILDNVLTTFVAKTVSLATEVCSENVCTSLSMLKKAPMN